MSMHRSLEALRARHRLSFDEGIDRAEYLVVTDALSIFGTTYHYSLYLRTLLASVGVTAVEVPAYKITSSLEKLLDRLTANRKLRVIHFMIEGIRDIKTLVQYSMMKWLVAELKRRRPDVLTLASGDYASHAGRWLIERNPGLDACIRFEPFFPAFEIGKTWAGDVSALDKIKGLVYHADGEILETGLSEWPASKRGAELDVLPSPFTSEFGALDPEEYPFYYVTTIGCPYVCGFCWCKNTQTRLRSHSIDRVIEDLHVVDDIYRYRLAEGVFPFGLYRIENKRAEGLHDLFVLTFYDLLFTADMKRTEALAAAMAAANFDLNFGFETRADRVDERTFDFLADAGFRWVNFGLESADARTLRQLSKVKKRADDGDYAPEQRFLDRMRELVPYANKLGYQTCVSVLVGLPGQSAEDFRETAKFVDELGADEVNQNPLGLIPGLPMFEKDRDKNLENLERTFLQVRPREFRYRDVWDALDNKFDQGDTLMWTSGAMRQVFHIDMLKRGAETIETKSDRVQYLSAHDSEALEELRPLAGIGTWALVGQTEDMEIWDLWKRHAPLTAFPLYGLSVLGDQPIMQRKPQDPFRGIDILRLPASWLIDENGEICAAPPPRLAVSTNSATMLALETREREDVEALGRMARRIHETGVLTIPHWIVDAWFETFDACRWAASRCPGLLGRSWSAAGGGKVAPCLTGHGMVPAGLDQQTTLRLFREACREIEERRGCATCSVAAHCSKCPSTGVLTEAEYCTIRRTLPQIVGVTELNAAHEIGIDLHQRPELADEAPFTLSVPEIKDRGLRIENVIEECGEPRGEPADWVVFERDGAIWLRINASLRLFALPDVLGEASELVARGYDEDQIYTYISARYEVDREELIGKLRGFDE